MTEYENSVTDIAHRVPLWIVWGIVFVLASFLLGNGQQALVETISSQGVSAEGVLFLAAIAGYTLPVVIGLAIISWIIDSTGSGTMKLVGVAATLYGMGLAAATVTSAAPVDPPADALACQRGSFPTMAFCYGLRGLGLLTVSYSWQFALAGVLVYAGLLFTFWRGAMWWQSRDG